MVNIDTVYQRVLALTNKEQRGYITPQDFNLFANQAQTEIFEQYFYDVNSARKTQGNDTVYADVDDMLEHKLQIFEEVDGPVEVSNYVGAGGGGINKILPDYIYRVHRVQLNNRDCEILNTKDFNNARQAGYLLQPTANRPIVNIRNNQMRCLPQGGVGGTVTPTGIFYFRIPARVNWGYIVMNKRAMYNNVTSVDFELHKSEETELVYRILGLAGISIKQPELLQTAASLVSSQIQQEKQ